MAGEAVSGPCSTVTIAVKKSKERERERERARHPSMRSTSALQHVVESGGGHDKAVNDTWLQ